MASQYAMASWVHTVSCRNCVVQHFLAAQTGTAEGRFGHHVMLGHHVIVRQTVDAQVHKV